MKILVIGNSHAASLKQGFDRVRNLPEQIELTWFTCAGREFYKLTCDKHSFGLQNATRKPEIERKLIKRNGAARISIEAFDRILIAGHTNGFLEIITLLAQFGVEAVHAKPRTPILAKDGFTQCLDHILQSRIPNWGSSVTGIPVDMIPAPRLTDDVEPFLGSAPKFRFCRDLRKENERLFEILSFAEQRYAAFASDAGIHVPPQPDKTISKITGLTLPIFNRQIESIFGQAKAPDGAHVNWEYGLLAVEEYLNYINAALPQRVRH